MKFGDLVAEKYLDEFLENKKQELKENERVKRARFIRKILQDLNMNTIKDLF